MIRIEAELPRNDLTAVTDALDMMGITVNVVKVKSRGTTVGSEVHAAKGTGMYRSEFRDKFILQTTVSDNSEHDVIEVIRANSNTGKISIFPISRIIDISSGVENEQGLALSEYDSVILIAANKQKTSFPFGLTTSKVKLEPQVIEGEKGYYDVIEKKFVPLESLESVISQVKPVESFQILTPDDAFVIQSLTRIQRNFSLYKRKQSDSYSQAFLKYVSNRFLSLWPENEINTAILYVDIVGSTKIATSLSSDDLSGLIKVFSEEMSVVVSKHAGFVLKYTGDAVIAFFPELKDFGNMAANAVRCARSMNMLVTHSLNPMFASFGLPKINVRIGIDVGKNRIVVLGSEPDLIGHSITIASKILPLAQPNQMTIGEEAYKMLSSDMATQFMKIDPQDKRWNYTHPTTGKIYPIYFSIPVMQISNHL
ncbi:adenylate/guanylate cyclase domain-containing protein [Candidatus Nitrosotalea okcheonensis]|uniref:Putative Adenylate cyclase n=1 Tax=Candidatus Nitrosotalea okcheonensis TaxID=1903276 RepID=A0A2H1FDM3_9ARCH|nr:adenylate/guanylate cyclase domain-containing protein [Candidatus Nitrosotalea okcheonensis]SMH70860.1 putative Adenylate cyclase [Candidatus Nitrosotalea okcheonensis]